MKKNMIKTLTTGVAFASLLFSGNALGAEKPQFTDIQGHWAMKYINQVMDMGVINGYEGNKFNPEATMNRLQLQALLMKASGKDVKLPSDVKSDFLVEMVSAFNLNAKVDNLTDENVAIALKPFKDQNKIRLEDRKAIAFLVKQGIILGTNSRELAIDSQLSRAEAFTFLARIATKDDVALKGPNMGAKKSNEMSSMKNKQMMMKKMKENMAESKLIRADISALLKELEAGGQLTADQSAEFSTVLAKMDASQNKMSQMNMKEMQEMMMSGAMNGRMEEQKNMVDRFDALTEKLRSSGNLSPEQLKRLEALQTKMTEMQKKMMMMCKTMMSNMDMKQDKMNMPDKQNMDQEKAAKTMDQQ